MKIEIRILLQEDIKDFIALINIFEDVFEMKSFLKPNNKHLQVILNKPNFLALVAKVGNKVLGGLTAYILHQYYSEKHLAYIYDLAVLKQYQRQGIGRTLLEHLTYYCKEQDFEEVFVQADRFDAHALDFYRSTNATNEKDVVQFSYLLGLKENKF